MVLASALEVWKLSAVVVLSDVLGRGIRVFGGMEAIALFLVPTELVMLVVVVFS